MTIQHGPDQAPHRRQRWIEIENVGGTAIPPHGVVEVVEHYRPEKDSTQTPYGGPTVVQVRRPTRDEICPALVNGPCWVQPGKRSRIGTNDYPALALLASNYPPGTVVGPKKDKFELYEGFCGFLVWGDYDGEKAQVVRWEDCERVIPVRANDCFYPGDTKIVSRMKISNGQITDTGEYIEVHDVECYVMALPNEIFWITVQRCDQTVSAYPIGIPIAPFGIVREVRVTSQIDPGQKGNAIILGNTSQTTQCVFDPTACTIEIINHTKRKLACDGHEDVKAFLMPHMCCWEVPNAPRAMTAQATLASNMCDGAGASVTGVTFLDHSGWTGTKPSSADNPFKLTAKAGSKVLLQYDDNKCSWYVAQVEHCLVERLMTDIRRNDCSIDRRVFKKSSLQNCDCTEYWENAITLYQTDMLSDIEVDCGTGGTGSTCAVRARKKQCCVFDDGCTDLGWTTILSGTTETFMTDVYQQGTDVWGDFMDVCVLCVYGTSSSIVLEGTDCDTGTGTGS